MPDAVTEIFVNTRLWFQPRASWHGTTKSNTGNAWPIDVVVKADRLHLNYKINYVTTGASLACVRVVILDPISAHNSVINVKITPRDHM